MICETSSVYRVFIDIPDLEALMKTMIPAHAEHHLTQVADRFDHWRQTRTTSAGPFPPTCGNRPLPLLGWAIPSTCTTCLSGLKEQR